MKKCSVESFCSEMGFKERTGEGVWRFIKRENMSLRSQGVSKFDHGRCYWPISGWMDLC